MFRKLSSVQLAVPNLLLIAAVVAYGTIIESRYNADYAKLIVYNSWWFQALLALLGLNILCAALSRIPYKKHHTGFVVTHLGMIILLVGSAITKVSGIDGSLSVAETTTGQSVVLDERVIEIVSDSVYKKVHVPRSISALSQSTLSDINDQLPFGYKIKRHVPFVRPTANFGRQGVTVEFKMQSPFFNQDVSLNSKAQPQVQMGPATIRLVENSSSPAAPEQSSKRKPQSDLLPADSIVISDAKTGQQIKQIRLSDFKKSPIEINGVTVIFKQVFARATVANNKISEGGEISNPAVEILAKKGDQSLREVLYAKYPNFSLNKDGVHGLRLVFVSNSAEQPETSPTKQENTSVSSTSSPKEGNVIELKYSQDNRESVRIQLFKNGQSVLDQELKKNQTLETPWMGIKLTLNEIRHEDSAGESNEVTEITPPAKSKDLPPSALLVAVRQGGEEKEIWLSEGQGQRLSSGNESVEIYYGRDVMPLPFSIELQKFFKKDYPGTETAISFESHVRVNGRGEPIVISMNEPLKQDGFTLYQSSYDMRPGQPVYSIFSVNRDPGRAVKYLGSIILALGIVIFTLMRSRYYKPQRGPK